MTLFFLRMILYLDDKFHVIKKIVAKTGQWDGEHWIFSIVQIFELGKDRKIIGEPIFLPKYVLQDSNATPDDLIQAGKESTMQSMNETREVIQVLKRNGLDYSSELTAFHDRFANSWMSLVVILIVLPVLAKSHVRSGLVLKVLLCLGLMFGYHLLHAITVAMGNSGALPPFLCAWSSHLVFGITAIVLIPKANF